MPFLSWHRERQDTRVKRLHNYSSSRKQWWKVHFWLRIWREQWRRHEWSKFTFLWWQWGWVIVVLEIYSDGSLYHFLAIMESVWICITKYGSSSHTQAKRFLQIFNFSCYNKIELLSVNSKLYRKYILWF